TPLPTNTTAPPTSTITPLPTNTTAPPTSTITPLPTNTTAPPTHTITPLPTNTTAPPRSTVPPIPTHTAPPPRAIIPVTTPYDAALRRPTRSPGPHRGGPRPRVDASINREGRARVPGALRRARDRRGTLGARLRPFRKVPRLRPLRAPHVPLP